MCKKFLSLSIFVIFSFSIASEASKSEKYNANYKSNTLKEKIEQMESLGLSKEAPFREPNVKALKKGLMIKSQINVSARAEFIGKEPIIPSDGSRDHCEEGYVDDCSGDEDCCPESWIGDGLCDGTDQEWGCDLSCYENDGGDCAGEGDGGGDDGSADDGGTGGDDGGVMRISTEKGLYEYHNHREKTVIFYTNFYCKLLDTCSNFFKRRQDYFSWIRRKNYSLYKIMMILFLFVLKEITFNINLNLIHSNSL